MSVLLSCKWEDQVVAWVLFRLRIALGEGIFVRVLGCSIKATHSIKTKLLVVFLREGATAGLAIHLLVVVAFETGDWESIVYRRRGRFLL